MENANPTIDSLTQLTQVRTFRKARRKKTMWGKSSLQPYRAELVQLRQAGASLGELQVWLKTTRGLRVARSTISRFLAKLPELVHG